jgi:MscS family membrane protein
VTVCKWRLLNAIIAMALIFLVLGSASMVLAQDEGTVVSSAVPTAQSVLSDTVGLSDTVVLSAVTGLSDTAVLSAAAGLSDTAVLSAAAGLSDTAGLSAAAGLSDTAVLSAAVGLLGTVVQDAGEQAESSDAPTIGSMVLGLPWKEIIQVILSTLVVTLIAIYAGRLVLTLLKRAVRRTDTDIDQGVLEAIKPQIGWFIAALGFQFVTKRMDFLSDDVKQLLQSVYFILYLFVIVATIWRLGDFAADQYVQRNKEKLNANLVDQIFPMLKRMFHLLLAFLGGAILAAYFGINILAVSTALGLSGFAIALAAKDSITNVISGFVIMVSQPFKVGDRIDVEGLGSWGDVVEIGIRSSKVLMRDNRLVIVPNSAIVDNTVVNYSLPDTIYRLQSDIGVGYGLDIPATQKMIKEAVRQVDSVLAEKPVDVWFTEFGTSSNTYRVRWWVKSYTEKRRSTDAVNSAIQALSDQGRLDMPNPSLSLENDLTVSDETIQRVSHAMKALN